MAFRVQGRGSIRVRISGSGRGSRVRYLGFLGIVGFSLLEGAGDSVSWL